MLLAHIKRLFFPPKIKSKWKQRQCLYRILKKVEVLLLFVKIAQKPLHVKRYLSVRVIFMVNIVSL